MRYQEILEACWSGYQQQGMKKKGDRMVPNCVPVSEQQMEEDLKKWFREKWVRFGPDGKIRGDCARGSESEGKPKCLPQSKAHALGKKGRASAAAKKRREDPNPERRGPARNVATRVKEQYTDDDDWYDEEDDRLKDGDYVRDRQDGEYGEIFRMSGDSTERRVRILDRDGRGWYISPDRLKPVDRNDPDIMRYFGKRRQRDMDEGWSDAVVARRTGRPRTPYSVYIKGKKWKDFENDDHAEAIANKLKAKFKADGRDPSVITIAPTEIIIDKDNLDEKQDACYRKVKSRYKVWPSAYASGALVQCRKKGAANWGTGAKKK